MPLISEIMSTDVRVVEPQETLRRAAEMMVRLDVGALPVVTDDQLIGMLTDRDIVVRGVAAGLGPDAGCVSDVMTRDLLYCTADQDTREVLALMGDRQVRRLPVVDAERHLVGIVSIGDLALNQPDDVGTAVSEISEPDKD
jgi:CBS domain-containing protein